MEHKRAIPILLLGFAVHPISQAQWPLFDGNNRPLYRHLKSITIQGSEVPGSLTNFPIAFAGTYGYLATTGNGGGVTNSNGYDIIFASDPGCAKPVPFERASYNATSGAVAFWFLASSLPSGSNTTFYLCYGNPSVTTDQSNASGVWTTAGNYAGVWHLNEASGSSSAKDSTSYASNCSVAGTGVSFGKTGEFSTAAQWTNSATSYLNCGHGASLDITGNMTAEAWINPVNLSTYQGIFPKESAVNGNLYEWMFTIGSTSDTTGANFGYYNSNSNWIKTNVTVNYAAWQHVVWVYSGTTLTVYKNGVAGTANTGVNAPTSEPTYPVFLGAGWTSVPLYPYDGLMQEVRFSNTARSANWIQTEYNNQSNLGASTTFYTVTSLR